MTAPLDITSKDNPLLQRLRRLARDPAGYRKGGELWLEGEHLCSALQQRGQRPIQGRAVCHCSHPFELGRSPGRAKRLARPSRAAT